MGNSVVAMQARSNGDAVKRVHTGDRAVRGRRSGTNSFAFDLRLLQFWWVSKLALGKGLGHWLKTRPAGKLLAGEAEMRASAEPGQVSPGVGVLLRGGNDEISENPQTVAAGKGMAWGKIKWFLWAGDLLLVVLCVMVVSKSGRPLNFFEFLLCVTAICIGAGLGIIGFIGPDFYWRKNRKE